MKLSMPHDGCLKGGTFQLKVARANGTNIYICDGCGDRKETKPKRK